MKLVIDIREDFYNSLLDDVEDADNAGVNVGTLERVIANGTPLPKEHGRLIDGTELKRKFIVYGYDYGGDVLDDMPTIIEVDKVESEDKEGGDSFD